MSYISKLDDIVRHIDNVRSNCMLLGDRLIDNGMLDLGRLLIANGFIHDNSKFYGVEWDYLNDETNDTDLLKLAITQHNRTNQHHPEYWGTIDQMPKLYVCEMLCDWKARSSEFGTSLQDWIEEGAASKFNYTKDSEIYRRITYYAGMLCDKPFKAI